MPTDAPYTISDLARITGLSVRTIRYYLAQGLIPASGESGPGAHYAEGHLARLRLIRRLQQQHLPLAEIRSRLAALTDEQVSALSGDAPVLGAAPETSALDYVRSVLAGSHRTVAPAFAVSPPTQGSSPVPSVPPAPSAPAMRDAPAASPASPAPSAPSRAARLLREIALPFASDVREAAVEPALPLATAALPPAIGAAPQSIERSQWERLSLGPNLELHIRRPLGRLEQKRVERLITIARQVLKEEQP